MRLKELRKQCNLTQAECAKYLGIALRTYQNYEKENAKVNSFKYSYMVQKLEKYDYVDEENGLLTLETIKTVCQKVFDKYKIDYCYLFGSYAKGTATEKSDVDLLISTQLSGLDFFELAESLRENLKKKIDLLNQRQIQDNFELTNEILKNGIKIYG